MKRNGKEKMEGNREELLGRLGAQFVFHFAAVAFYGFRLLCSWFSLDFSISHFSISTFHHLPRTPFSCSYAKALFLV